MTLLGRVVVVASILAAAAYPPDACLASGSAEKVATGHDMTGKTVFMTGGDSGIGYETALALARIHATVIIANHNGAKGHQAAANITRLTGNANVESLEVNLASFKSVRALAASVLAKHTKLDFVLFDAGIAKTFGSHAPLTEDGFEQVMQINYISHFLLGQLFIPAIRAAKGKLTVVSSGDMYVACLIAGLPLGCTDDLRDDFDQYVRVPKGNLTSNYGITKVMLIQLVRELTDREAASGSGMRAYAIRPGLVDTPLLRHIMPESQMKSACAWPSCSAGFTRWGRCQKPCPMPQEAGAVSPTFVAVTDLPASQDGSLYWQCEAEAGPKPGKTKEKMKENQVKLYEMSLKWTGTGETAVLV